MSLRRILMTACLAVAIWAVWHFGFVPDAFWGSPAWRALSSGAGLTAAAVLALLALGLGAFGWVRHRERQARRQADAVMHAFQLARKANPDNTDLSVSRIVLDEDAAAEQALAQSQDDEPSPAIEMPELNRSTGERDLALQPAAKSAAEDVGGRIYFQPSIDVPTGRIVTYDVYRPAIRRNTKRHSFVQYGKAGGRATRVRFELETFNLAAAEARRIASDLEVGPDPVVVDVPVSMALVEDSRASKTVRSLYRAHPALKSLLRLSIDASTLRAITPKATKALRALNFDGIALSINVRSALNAALGPDVLELFDAVCLSKTLVQQAAMRTQSQQAAGTAASSENMPAKAEPVLERLIEAMQAAGRTVIARDVVCEADIVDMLAEDITVMSGKHFAAPRPLRDDLMTVKAEALNEPVNLAG